VKLAQPATAACGLLVTMVVALALTVLIRLIVSVEPVPEVTLLPAASRTQTVTLDVATPFAGIGFGVNEIGARVAAAPKPVKEADEPVASQV